MLTVADFYDANATYHRRMRWVFSLLFVLWLGVLGLGCWGAFELIDRYLRPHVPRSTRFLGEMLAVVVLCVVSFLPLILRNRLGGRLVGRHDPRLACPHCGWGLVCEYTQVMASHACPRCEREILCDPFPQRPAPLSREEADARAAAWRREHNRRTYLGGLLSFLMLLWFWGLEVLKERDLISDRDSEVALWIMLAAVWSVLIWIGIRRRDVLPLRVTCPRCGSLQEPPFVVRFGRCGMCSQPLVAEAEPGVAAGAAAG